ncbi:MAG: hypothetical protein HGB02_03745 [Chlorobiaceae bacterium]|nr:hypothetical protein [Chlorobiaceae bacterium]
MKPSISDIIFVIGLACLISGVALQYGIGVALIVSGVVLLFVSIYPHIKRKHVS